MAEPESPPKKRCFVVGPIGKPESEIRVHADWFFDGIILPVFKARDDLKDFNVIRADKIAAPGMIDAQVIGLLLDAELVIADLSRTNANAFYEIGIRHMIELPIIHMHEDGGEIPFDVSLYRSIPFSRSTPTTLKKAQGDLAEAISAVLAPAYECDNPVIRARGRIRVEQTASPELRAIVDQLQALSERIDAVESPVRHTSSGQIPPPGVMANMVQFKIEFDQQYEEYRKAPGSFINVFEKHFVVVANTIGYRISSYTKQGRDFVGFVEADRTRLTMLDLMRKQLKDFEGVKSVTFEILG